MVKSYSYRDCWKYAFEQGISLPKQKKELISLCQVPQEEFWLDFFLRKLESRSYQQICQKIQQLPSVPLAYLNQEIYFYNSLFKIQKGVFIPQKDTEILLEKVQQLTRRIWKSSARLKVLDLATGCGNLAICLAKNNPHWQITASDNSPKAVRTAKKNVRLQRINNVQVKKSDLFSNLGKAKYNIIVSNPPYLSWLEYSQLSWKVKQQPKRALLASDEGYEFYQKILEQSAFYLKKRFLLALEIGYQQATIVLKILIRKLPKTQVEVFNDWGGLPRVAVAYRVW